jgi:D-glycerate 3-kinase
LNVDEKTRHALPECLGDYLAQQQLPDVYAELVKEHLLPLAEWLQGQWGGENSPLLVGIHGSQGSGKSTACGVLQRLLELGGVRCEILSLDDFYLPRAQRQALARNLHPLLLTRGAPGTHDVALLEEVLDRLVAGEDVLVPRFSKADDEPLPREEWSRVQQLPNIILLEGWCIGCRPQDSAALVSPINGLEARGDVDGRWRTFINEALRQEYGALFERLNRLVMFKVPSMEQVLEWRWLQELKLAEEMMGQAVMSQADVAYFVQHFERLTRYALAEMPARADYLLELDADHQVFRSGPQ